MKVKPHLPHPPHPPRRHNSSKSHQARLRRRLYALQVVLGFALVVCLVVVWQSHNVLISHHHHSRRQRHRQARARKRAQPHHYFFQGINPLGLFRRSSTAATTTATTTITKATASDSIEGRRFLIFIPPVQGQGLGNWMNGLLAATLLGEEFDRTVCVSREWNDFYQAFRPINDVCRAYFQSIGDSSQNNGEKVTPRKLILTVYNWRFQGPDECALMQRLSSEEPILYFRGNTYPRWPSSIPPALFDKYYKPTEQLLRVLPWKTTSTGLGTQTENNEGDAKRVTSSTRTSPPQVLVHLRMGDGGADHRAGLDDATLQALARDLPSSTFLVTNRVAWYDYFAPHGWSHPNWNMVVHSAFSKDWGGRNTMDVEQRQQQQQKLKNDHTVQNLWMYSDWYTLLRAKRVYHTHSDFSASAVHWMGSSSSYSQRINGVKKDGKTLDLSQESWLVERETPKLSERTVHKMEGKEQCRRH